MPELPEVETTVRALRPLLSGDTIIQVRCQWPRHIATPSLEELQFRLHHKQILDIRRRAKYLLFCLSEGERLIIHLKMSGRLLVTAREEVADKHVHTVFALASGRELRFWDQRKFGRVYLVQDTAAIFAHLGPEPLLPAFTAAVLGQRLHGRRRALKPLLLDQTFIAGVGNIYADEALFYAGLDPRRGADTLTGAEISALHQAIRKALQLGIDREGASLDLYLKPDGSRGQMQNAVAVFRRTNLPCRQCGTPINRIVLGGRSTHFCPHCQS